MSGKENPDEKIAGAEVEENETRLGSPPATVDIEDRPPHIHLKTIVLVFVSCVTLPTPMAY